MLFMLLVPCSQPRAHVAAGGLRSPRHCTAPSPRPGASLPVKPAVPCFRVRPPSKQVHSCRLHSDRHRKVHFVNLIPTKPKPSRRSQRQDFNTRWWCPDSARTRGSLADGNPDRHRLPEKLPLREHYTFLHFVPSMGGILHRPCQAQVPGFAQSRHSSF